MDAVGGDDRLADPLREPGSVQGQRAVGARYAVKCEIPLRRARNDQTFAFRHSRLCQWLS